MDTLYFVSELRTGATGEKMISKPIPTPLIQSTQAANADQLAEAGAQIVAARAEKGIEATGGWDAYEVWRRFIKEARERRKTPDTN